MEGASDMDSVVKQTAAAVPSVWLILLRSYIVFVGLYVFLFRKHA